MIKIICSVIMLSLFVLPASAKRLGGGKNLGTPSPTNSSVQRTAPPTNPATTNPTTNPSAAANPAANVAGSAAKKSLLGGLLGGLVAGAALAWLAHSLGIGEGLLQALLFGVLILLAVAVIRAFLMRRAQTKASNLGTDPNYAFSGASYGTSSRPVSVDSQNPAYKADLNPSPSSSLNPSASLNTSPSPSPSSLSSELNVPAFLENAKIHFRKLQKAWDIADINQLKDLLSEVMLAEIQFQIEERNGKANHTEILELHAEFVGIDDFGNNYVASVRFSGIIVEEVAEGPKQFSEVWTMTKPRSGETGWLVSGIQNESPKK
ncbi:MAG: TIM44-like domain-containing protein [Gammaproteobacteria bacterium]|nr:TIM44-like domain-containing protein [Gammaproteobacteria bacterium]